MTHSDAEEPVFWYVHSIPAELSNRPGIASSLQGIETSFLLVSEDRYPHALLALVTSLEGALKAAGEVPPEDRRTGLDRLLKSLRSGSLLGTATSSPPCPVSWSDLDDLRDTRNRVAHRGYSPRDNQVCADLLLRTGYPFALWLYETAFGLDFMRILYPRIREHLQVALKVYPRLRDDGADADTAFVALGHLLQWGARKARAAYWELEISESNYFDDERYQHVSKAVESRIARTDPAWAFDCPVCGDVGSFVCGLRLDVLAEGGPDPLDEGLCLNCQLRIPAQAQALTSELCRAEAVERAPEILAAFGYP